MRTLKSSGSQPWEIFQETFDNVYRYLGLSQWGWWGGGGGGWMPLPSSGQRSGMLPNALQSPGQLPTQRIIWPQKSVVTPLKTLIQRTHQREEFLIIVIFNILSDIMRYSERMGRGSR